MFWGIAFEYIFEIAWYMEFSLSKLAILQISYILLCDERWVGMMEFSTKCTHGTEKMKLVVFSKSYDQTRY